MSRFLSERLASLQAYTPGEQPQDRKYIKLNTNESPYPPSPQVAEAIGKDQIDLLNLYPDPTCRDLKKRLADRYGVSTSMVFVSNGSDDILNFAFMAFCHKEKGIAFPDITYGFYKVFAQLHQIEADVIPLNEDFTVDTESFEKCRKNVVIANPNAPTGIQLTLDKIRGIVEANRDSVVIIDEAYVDFGGESALALVPEFDNLLVVRTFSKSRSMAGARLGFAIGSPELIEDLELIKYSTNPYDINRLTQIAGCAAIDSDGYYFDNAEKIMETREYTSKRLAAAGFQVIPSKANFVFVRHPELDGEETYLSLKRIGILVRHFNNPRIKDYLRITIGLREEMEELCRALEAIAAEKGN